MLGGELLCLFELVVLTYYCFLFVVYFIMVVDFG